MFDLIEQLIQTYSSVEIATDDKQTPRQHARFLSSLLSKHRKGLPPGTLVAWQSGTTASSTRNTGQRQPVPEQSRTETTRLPESEEVPESPVDEPQTAQDQDTTRSMDFDDELLGALEVFKDPGYWKSMMMPEPEYAPLLGP